MNNAVNGNAYDRHTAADEDMEIDDSWQQGDLDDPEVLRKALVGIEQRLRVALRVGIVNKRGVAGLRGELAERDALILKSLAAIHGEQQTQRALLQTVAVRVARLDNEGDVTQQDVRGLRALVERVKAANRSDDPRTAAQIARLEAKVEMLERHTTKLETDVETTQQREIAAAVAKAAQLETAKSANDNSAVAEDRKDRRATKEWVLKILGALILLAASAFAGSKISTPASPFTSTPGAQP